MNPISNKSDYMRVSEVAELLNVSARWVYQRIWSGELPATKTGKLYFVRRKDVDRLLGGGADAPAPDSPTLRVQMPAVSASFSTGGLDGKEKCGYCRKYQPSDQMENVCEDEDCEVSICKQCWQAGNHTCQEHLPSPEDWQREVEANPDQYPVQVAAQDARYGEINFIDRIRTSLFGFNTIMHPQTEELLIIDTWAKLEHAFDQRRELMQYLGRFTLSTEMTQQYPLNQTLRYQIESARSKDVGPLIIEVRVLSHLQQMTRFGLDTNPFTRKELIDTLLSIIGTGDTRQASFLILLAATTGWEAAAREAAASGSRDPLLTSRNVRFYLYDMQLNKMIYNEKDRTARGYAELFSPLLPEEQLDDVMEALEARLQDMLYEHINLAEAQKLLPNCREPLLRRAFERLASEGGYELDDSIGDSLTLIRK